jgi:signal transduction histidine kinase
MQMLVPAAYRDELDGAINKNQTPRWNLAGATREFHGLHKDGTHLNLEIGVSEVLPGKVYTGILRDISPRKKLEREVTEISAREQYRIGQELHDGVSQEVTGLTLMATTLRDQLKEERSACEPSAERLMAGLRQVHKRIRAISHGLVPVDVDAEGLRSALEDFVDRIRQQTEVACEFHCPRPVLVKDSLTATNLFYIVQEAVNNALRHGRAGAIDIFLHSRPDALVLTVRDDGVGIVSEENQAKGIGMRLMNHRANLVGGMLRVHSNGERGTVVTCTISHHGRQDD